MISDLHHPRHVPGCVASTLAGPLFLGLRELSEAVTARVARPQKPVIHHPKVAALPSRLQSAATAVVQNGPTTDTTATVRRQGIRSEAVEWRRLHLALCAGQVYLASP